MKSFVFKDIPSELSEILQKDDQKRIIVGVIGRSFRDCNKMKNFNLFNNYIQLTEDPKECKEGRIKFYFETSSNILYVHFETSFDSFIMYNLIDQYNSTESSFNSSLRTKFGRMLLFAIQVCHIIVLVEPSSAFDSSYLSIFKSLKLIREKYVLKFLPKLLKNSTAGSLVKEGRLCSPRFLFFFEKLDKPERFKNVNEIYEFEIHQEDDIYTALRNDYIITNNATQSLFSIPKNKRFVFFNSSKTSDPNEDSIAMLLKYIAKADSSDRNDQENEDEDSEIRPYRGYAKPFALDFKNTRIFGESNDRSFINLINEHVEEAMQFGFDDSLSKFRGKIHFVRPTCKSWFEIFKIMHKIFIENPDNPSFEPNDPDYKSYLDNFHKIMDIDDQFFFDPCVRGFDMGIMQYNEQTPHHYSRDFHESKIEQALEVLYKYAKGPELSRFEKKLKEVCENIWLSGKQQCEHPSLRGNPCIKAIHDDDEHSSGVVNISTCNCGKTQGRREDPYSVRQANYEFYQLMAKSCVNCNKLEKITFPVFQPSVQDFRAAEMNKKETSLQTVSKTLNDNKSSGQTSLHLSASQKTQNSVSNLSLGSDDEDKPKQSDIKSKSMSGKKELDKSSIAGNSNTGNAGDSDEESMNEIVIKVGQLDLSNKALRQVSTIEYLPNMLQASSPVGLLPRFPSWSLVCIGPSSIYSHNTGLPEHVQSGFLTGTNFLLAWDVHVRLEHSKSWAENYTRNRKKQQNQAVTQSKDNNHIFTLKVFVGVEYECPKGHRFIMNSNKTVLRGSAGGKENGNKVVYNDMPLYFPCPCRNSAKPTIAQLSKIHLVTPKAPVNVIINPKVKIVNKTEMIFTTGLSEAAKLSQSSYWILRLPYVYNGDDGQILPPLEVDAESAINFGVLMSGMYGVRERVDRE